MGMVKGKISDITTGLSGGFIKCKGLTEDVFFSSVTKYLGTTYEALNVGQDVQIEVIETPRGLFAESLQPVPTKASKVVPELSP